LSRLAPLCTPGWAHLFVPIPQKSSRRSPSRCTVRSRLEWWVGPLPCAALSAPCCSKHNSLTCPSLPVHYAQDDLSDVRHRQRRLEQWQAADEAGGGPAPLLQLSQASPQALGVQASGSKGVVDMFGNHVQPVALDQVSCPNCGRAMAAGRFAPHLEKCMGRGRQASRAAPMYKEAHL